jgi:hypothetical protein
MTNTTVDRGRSRPVIALDGSESMQGRALFVLSALTWCLDWLPAVDLRLIDVTNEDVTLAAKVFMWEHGINVAILSPESDESPLSGADIYAAVTFRSASHLRIKEAASFGIPVLLAMQFPDTIWLSGSVLCRRPSAFDPRLFANDLGAIVKRWL